MSKDQVEVVIGPPGDIIGSKAYENGSIVEVLYYYEAEMGVTVDYIKKEYFLYFVDDVLVEWGPPGAWKRQADEIIEIRSN